MDTGNRNGNPTPGGSGTARTVPVQAQNVVIDANAQAAAAQMAQQILANTNVTLKQELVKIPDFWGEKGKDTVTPTQFMARIDECQIANDWNDTTTYANFSLCLRGEADKWLASKVRLLELTPAQKTWTRIRPLFKKEFAACSDDKLIIDGLANLAHKPGENPRKFMSRLEKLFNTLHENYASYRIKPERPAPLQPQGTYTQDMLTAFANDSVRAYNKFLLAQVFWAAAPENVRKLLSHKDQTRMTVDDAYDTFFTDHRVENDKKERAMVNVIDDEQESGSASTEQDIAAFRPQQRQQQQRYGQQQTSNYRSNQTQQQKGKSNKNSYPKKTNNTTSQGNSGNGKFCAYCKILNHSQEECRKRMRDNKPCVNNQGKLYWPKVNSTTENNDPNNVGAVFQ
jgi:hypothetical protein